MRGNGLKLHKKMFTSDFRKKVFKERVVKPENRMFREVVEAPSLETFQKHAYGI